MKLSFLCVSVNKDWKVTHTEKLRQQIQRLPATACFHMQQQLNWPRATYLYVYTHDNSSFLFLQVGPQLNPQIQSHRMFLFQRKTALTLPSVTVHLTFSSVFRGVVAMHFEPRRPAFAPVRCSCYSDLHKVFLTLIHLWRRRSFLSLTQAEKALLQEVCKKIKKKKKGGGTQTRTVQQVCPIWRNMLRVHLNPPNPPVLLVAL